MQLFPPHPPKKKEQQLIFKNISVIVWKTQGLNVIDDGLYLPPVYMCVLSLYFRLIQIVILLLWEPVL